MLFHIVNTKVNVLGTMHFLPSNFTLPPSWVEAFKLSEVVLGELLPGVYVPAPYSLLPSGVLLSQLISSAEYASLEKLWAGFGMDMALLPISKPWAVCFFLGVNLIRRDIADGVGVEQLLQIHAPASQIRRALEEERDQWLVFDGIKPAEQFERLSALIGDPTLPAKQFKQVQQAWVAGDPNALWNSMANSPEMKASPDFFDRLFRQRNERWRPLVMESLAATERTFIMVGAGHLCGPNGVLAIAQEAGFETIRV